MKSWIILPLLCWATALAQPANEAIPLATPAVSIACNCTGRAYTGKVPHNVLDSCRSLAANALREAEAAHPRLQEDIQLAFDQQTADCLIALKGQTLPDRKALALADYRIHYQQRLDKEEPLPLAKELALKLCACRQQPAAEDWCQEKTALMVELFQEKYGDDRSIMDQVYQQNMPILQGCQ